MRFTARATLESMADRPEIPASVRVERARIDAATEELDLTDELVAAGLPWPEADMDGQLVWRDPQDVAARPG